MAVSVGDIVNFYTGAWIFSNANERYRHRNPGVIIEVSIRPDGVGLSTILWADGSTTTEHQSYLKKEEEKCMLEIR